jgi:uncharacterized protein
MTDANEQDRFHSALDQLIEQIRRDRTVLAAILCGSLAHDVVWSKSDIDLALVTQDDKPGFSPDSISLNADGVNVHAFLVSRTEFRKTVEGSVRNSFMHSLLAKGRLLYSNDETINRLCERLVEIGERDTQVQLLRAAAALIGCLDKARKWLVTRQDFEYSALWVLYAATPLAQIEVLSVRQLIGREVIPQALKLNPELFSIVYTQMLNTKKSRKSVEQALQAAEGYLAERSTRLCKPVLDYLKEEGETRSVTEIETHFKRNFGVECTSLICEYLADRKLIAKVSVPAQLTKRSNVQVQELAFVFTDA